MTSWLDLEHAAPHITTAGHALLLRARVAMLGTLRPDGSPRISPIEPAVTDGQLIFGVMPWSGKARDLHRDQRCVLHNAISSPDAGEPELKLSGVAAAALRCATQPARRGGPASRAWPPTSSSWS
jgi:hypothetical protein